MVLMTTSSQDRTAYLRNFVFGVEDSLVSTVGLLSGVAIAGMAREDILTTGLILILVEAISMSAGSFLSESSAEELETHQEAPTHRSYLSALVMFASYLISGLIPLAPYLLFTGSTAFLTSIGVSLGALLLLGAVSARVAKTRLARGAFRVALIGGLAIGAGMLVGGLVGN